MRSFTNFRVTVILGSVRLNTAKPKTLNPVKMENSMETTSMETQTEKNMEHDMDAGVTLMVWPLCVFVSQRLLISCLISGQVCGTT